MEIDSQLEGVDITLRFWKDGTPRLTAYEYQGLLLSAEHAGTDLNCTSCHNVHGGDPKGMLDDAMRGPAGCLQCHEAIAPDVAGHTRHAADGAGSDCYACHMPRVTYGLLTLHRTHRIQNPEHARAWRYAMPEACTLCHTNETVAWAALTLAEQYGVSAPADLPVGGTFDIAENLRALLSGDAVQRAAAAAALGSEDSYTADPMARLWMVPFALITMEDAYPSIRFIAQRSLAQLVERARLQDGSLGPAAPDLSEFDYLGDEAARRAALDSWWQWWRVLDKGRIAYPGPAVPLDADLMPVNDVIDGLIARQSRELIFIGE